MRVATATTVLVGLLALTPFGAAATPAVARPPAPAARIAGALAANPSPARIIAAVRRAETNKGLWATVNICDTNNQPNVLGVRGQMPSLGFPAWLSMEIALEYYNRAHKRFQVDPGTTKTIRLGRSANGLQQGGATYTFPGPTPVLEASVRFVWRRSGRLLGTTRTLTTSGHPDADFGSPPRYSAATCRIH